jgi:hypothetical protein
MMDVLVSRPSAASAGIQNFLCAGSRVSLRLPGTRKTHYTVAPFALARRKCSSSRGMISTKLQGR